MAVEFDAHIAIIATCTECGHAWDVEAYDEERVETAVENAQRDEKCPFCADGA